MFSDWQNLILEVRVIDYLEASTLLKLASCNHTFYKNCMKMNLFLKKITTENNLRFMYEDLTLRAIQESRSRHTTFLFSIKLVMKLLSSGSNRLPFPSFLLLEILEKYYSPRLCHSFTLPFNWHILKEEIRILFSQIDYYDALKQLSTASPNVKSCIVGPDPDIITIYTKEYHRFVFVKSEYRLVLAHVDKSFPKKLYELSAYI